ncbi:MAG: hypothetical protein RLZ39_1679 [Bacteroidota bacterium]|jgi:hypothetical protein
MAPKKGLNVSANPLPISFKDFARNPIVGTLFLVIVGISALYVDIRSNFNSRIDNQEQRINKLEFKDSLKTQALIECKTALSSTTTKLETLDAMGAIKKSVK